MSRRWRVEYEGWMDFDEDEDEVHSAKEAQARLMGYINLYDDSGIAITDVFEIKPVAPEATPLANSA